MTRLGYQIPNFTYPDIAGDAVFENLVAQARAAEDAGFDRVMVMDHFYQLPGLGAPDEPMFECYTLLSALAQHTNRVRLSALVTGNTYRNPALLAKTITALDHVSGGRATLGIGAGWFEARGVATDHHPAPEWRARLPRREALPGRRCGQRPGPVVEDPAHDRRGGREEDASHGRAIRRRVEPVGDSGA
jgi:alkanesulfonate monooxygenase SsuD/methylene tetrahydromethanopterin reductase-like flavin-dependent oxidoreductase (luciferase family)